LQEIDEESCSSLEANTPSFGFGISKNEKHLFRKNKIKTEIDDLNIDPSDQKHIAFVNLVLTSNDNTVNTKK
jgi:hypothetical protein